MPSHRTEAGWPAVIPCYHRTYPALVPTRVVFPPSCPFIGTSRGAVPPKAAGQEGRERPGLAPMDLHRANPGCRSAAAGRFSPRPICTAQIRRPSSHQRPEAGTGRRAFRKDAMVYAASHRRLSASPWTLDVRAWMPDDLAWAPAIRAMDAGRIRHRRRLHLPWTLASHAMGARLLRHGRLRVRPRALFAVRIRAADHRGMKAKPPKSPALTEVNQHFDEEYERIAKGMDKALEDWFGFPHGHRGAVFCWLWDNHDGVVHAIKRHGLTWNGIARIATEDGLEGRWGKPPTGNAMRRTWARVCVDLKWWKEREERRRQARPPS